MSTPLNRREFMNLTVAGAATAAVSMHASAVESKPNDRVIIGVMGLSRGHRLAMDFAKQPNVEVRYLCDADSKRAESSAGDVGKHDAQSPKPITDFRRILDDGEVDALVCAAPNHWHAPAAILGCNAGKHVYVEKPCCHNPREGELMIEAAKKHNRIVQVGTQRRSSPTLQEAIGAMRDGEIGNVYSSRANYASARRSIGAGKPADVPANLNYELWQGPAPRTPYTDNRIHYNWHWFWHWGNGELGNNGVHTLDICRWGLGVDYPTHVTSIGGRYVFDDDQQTPDTHTVGYTFDGGKMITWQGHSCNKYGSDFVNFYGDNGTITVADDCSYTVYDLDNKEVRSVKGARGDVEHIVNFIDAIRNDSAQSLNADVSIHNPSTLLCHLGNIAQRTGGSIVCDASNGHIKNHAAAEKLWTRDYEPGWEPKA